MDRVGLTSLPAKAHDIEAVGPNQESWKGDTASLDGVEAPARAILRHIRENPGCNLSQARQQARLSRRRFDETLETLLRLGLVKRFSLGSACYVFPPLPDLSRWARQFLALRKHHVTRFYAWLQKRGPCSCPEAIAFATKDLGWSEAVTRKRILMLATSGLIADLDPPVGNDQRCRWIKAESPASSVPDLLALIHRE